MRFSSFIALASAATFLGPSCETGNRDWGQSHLAHGWAKSSYRLPFHESARFKREARAARQNGNREVCGAILRRSGDDGTLELVFTDNESRHAHSYELSPRSVKQVRGIAHARKVLCLQCHRNTTTQHSNDISLQNIMGRRPL